LVTRKGMEMATSISVEKTGVVIPLKMLENQDEGITILTLADGAYLIIRSDLLAAYPRQRLLELSRTAQAMERVRVEKSVTFTPRKQRALRELSQAGYSISNGLEYGLQTMAQPEITLKQVWEGLSTMEGSLSQEVLAEREER